MATARRTVAAPEVSTHWLTAREPTVLDEAFVRGFELALRSGWRPRVTSPKSIRAYLYGVRSLIGFLRARGMPELTSVTREHVQEWVLAMRATRSAATVRGYLIAARLLFQWLIDEGERGDDPTVRLAAPQASQTLKPRYTIEQVQALLRSQNPATLVGLRNIALFYLLLDTGLRCAEVASLTVADVDFRHGTVRVVGKGAKERKVGFGSLTTRALDTYLRRRERSLPGMPWLWHSQKGGRLTAAGIGVLHKDLSKRLGFRAHAHRFRHSMAQMALESGMEMEHVRVLLGHEGYASMAPYIRAGEQDRALVAHAKASPVDALLRGRRR